MGNGVSQRNISEHSAFLSRMPKRRSAYLEAGPRFQVYVRTCDGDIFAEKWMDVIFNHSSKGGLVREFLTQMMKFSEANNNFQTDKSRLSCLSRARKPRQPAFAAEARRYVAGRCALITQYEFRALVFN